VTSSVLLPWFLLAACRSGPEQLVDTGTPGAGDRASPSGDSVPFEDTGALDADDDRWTVDEDCDDHDPTTHPGASDTSGDGVDQDCDGVDGVDADGDGVASEGSGGSDCDDEDPGVSPLQTEVCDNHLDEDCEPRSPACGLPAELSLGDVAVRLDGASGD